MCLEHQPFDSDVIASSASGQPGCSSPLDQTNEKDLTAMPTIPRFLRTALRIETFFWFCIQTAREAEFSEPDDLTLMSAYIHT